MTSVQDSTAPTPRREDILSQTTILLFSVTLGMATVVVPLVATAAGYQLGAVGFLVGVSAITQIIARAGMGALMDRFSTRTFVLVALILLASSCVILGVTDELWAFVASQLLQGAARAYFFTGMQTHVIRASRPAVSALAIMNVTNGVGLLIGPLLAGIIGASSLSFALFIAAGIAGPGVLSCAFLIRYEPFAKPRTETAEKAVPMWRRDGVTTAGWMGATAGGWRGILNSYLPVLLTEAGHSIPVVGAMMTLANLAALAGSAVARPVRRTGVRLSAVLGAALAVGGVALMAFMTPHLVLAGAFLFISGVGAGILQTLGPALATEAVGLEERGRAIASVGTFRAISLLVTPMGIGALIFLVPSAAVATAIVAVAVGIPAMATRDGTRRKP
ncbi:MFS transporter [Paeniglutamicibacter sulfureus]|uniref:MFS family permease n=1 Tax=Paeniglutamicibacter sulfureus TaxID=43666 RepID=A0ABU2BH04_9MICC|nr:MFS transporter [Paeniglutamicibacter sulfureus]MDR7357895.1 MFS family permease [Paeniglutamicibacter sulfureus]